MRIALIGYGRMGRIIEEIAEERGHEIVLRATSDAPVSPSHFPECDVAIEFSVPKAAVSNILACFEANIPVVCGTTGWYNRIPEVRNYVEEHQGALLYASNFSLGVNVFNLILEFASEKLKRTEEYHPSMEESHHIHKLDAPSGTALTLADTVLDQFNDLDGWTDKNEENKLNIDSIREGEIFGIHEVSFTSDNDKIQLKHEALNRKGFASGAVRAAEWLKDQQGLFTMNDLLQSVLK